MGMLYECHHVDLARMGLTRLPSGRITGLIKGPIMKYVSDCCLEEISTAWELDENQRNYMSLEGSTNYWVCNKCNKACALVRGE